MFISILLFFFAGYISAILTKKKDFYTQNKMKNTSDSKLHNKLMFA